MHSAPCQATDSGSSRNMPHFGVHGGHVKRSRLLGACFSRRSVSHRGHLQSVCSSSSGSSPQKGHRGDSAHWQSNCLFCVQTQPQRSSRRSFRCSGEILVLFMSLVVASVSTPAMDSMPLMSLRLFTAFFPFGKPQSLPDLVEPPAFGAVQQSQVGTPFSREKRRRLPVPTHPMQHAVYSSHWPIARLITVRIAAPNTLQLRKGLRPLLCHASQLSQTLV